MTDDVSAPAQASTHSATFRFKDISAIVHSLGVVSKQVDAAWRITAWQKGGYLPALGDGKGTRTDYPLGFVWRVCLLAKFQQLGIPPSNAVAIIERQPIPPLTSGFAHFVADEHGSKVVIALSQLVSAIEARVVPQ